MSEVTSESGEGTVAPAGGASVTIAQVNASAQVRMFMAGKTIAVDASDVEHFESLGFKSESDEMQNCPSCGAAMCHLDERDAPGDRCELPDGNVVCSACYSKAMTPGPGHPLYELDPARFTNG